MNAVRHGGLPGVSLDHLTGRTPPGQRCCRGCASQIAALEAALAAVGDGVPVEARVIRSVRGNPAGSNGSNYRPGSLKDHIQRVLAGSAGPMPVSGIAAAVVRSGFKSKNKTLGTSVGIALAGMPEVQRVSRGVYGLR